MQIANPIYDVVFKYLMEDSKIAKLVISSIIGEEITSLTFQPQEIISDDISLDNKKSKRKSKLGKFFTVYRLDFAAKIKTEQGFKTVIIELQKAKYPTDIMRFRKYLAEQLSNKENVQRKKIGSKVRKVGLPIVSIYFLGHKLDNTTSSAIKISRQYNDLITNEIIEVKEDFIESLTLDSYVIQIPYLKDKRRNELEILLSIFDQTNPADSQHHILNVDEHEFPDKYRPIIRRLQKAILDSQVKQRMDLEDGIIEEFEDLERTIEELESKNEKTEQENIQVRQKLDVVEQEKERVKQENELLRKRLEELEKNAKKL